MEVSPGWGGGYAPCGGLLPRLSSSPLSPVIPLHVLMSSPTKQEEEGEREETDQLSLSRLYVTQALKAAIKWLKGF